MATGDRSDTASRTAISIEYHSALTVILGMDLAGELASFFELPSDALPQEYMMPMSPSSTMLNALQPKIMAPRLMVDLKIVLTAPM